MLDLFAYTGGFAAAAARGGARHVTLVESSASALELARENLSASADGSPPDFDLRLTLGTSIPSLVKSPIPRPSPWRSSPSSNTFSECFSNFSLVQGGAPPQL